ncbi:MAG: hypothetical protein ACI85I_002209, partial [Arenicella sp.]
FVKKGGKLSLQKGDLTALPPFDRKRVFFSTCYLECECQNRY